MSIQIGPPVGYEDAGRYICLVNNPEGHAHKEMFLEVGHRSLQNGMDGYNNQGKPDPHTISNNNLIFLN